MDIIKTIPEIRSILRKHRRADETIGFVPTMGYFHEGHLSLMDIAREKSDILVISIFVNPTQFGPDEDLERYPRDLEHDARLAEERGVDYIFHPDVDEMYSPNFSTYVKNLELSNLLCGATRDNHFRGVTTIVSKLFNIINPDLAVFGQKDHQQAIIIKRMVEDLNFPVEIVLGDIIREADGLAKSSRNTYLNGREREQAPIIYQALKEAKKMVEEGERSAGKVKKYIRDKIDSVELSEIEYVEIVEDTMLGSVDKISRGNFAAVAVWFGDTRLIDNIILL
ncbi:MAG: pantoate--beta-alanine ligase [Candidatus Marinimicrobia bacterium]|nr:pantoate--beta-alanine ligase [Candidatus Neomarinimicrobiota bacterium]